MDHITLLLTSYRHLTGRTLLEPQPPPELLLHAVDEVPLALLSHGTEADPIFNYGNRMALMLFAMSWQEFTVLPSRYCAEQSNREERERLLREVEERGFIDNYSGVRIVKDGSRFMIEAATVWSVIDEAGRHCGQAATFSELQPL